MSIPSPTFPTASPNAGAAGAKLGATPLAKPPRIGVIGAGYWGRNHVRVFHQLGALAAVIDGDAATRAALAAKYPGVRMVASLAEIGAGELDGVVIATPASTHESIAIDAISRGLHVLVEKPCALTLAGVRRMCDAARTAHRVIAVGHLLLHHAHLREAKRLLDAGAVGTPLYVYGQRVNLGRVRTDEDVITALAPHDLSMAGYLFGLEVASAAVWTVTAIPKPKPLCDVAFISLEYAGGLRAHFHLSWLDPFKRRELVVVGTTGMLVFDDMQPKEKLRIYDKAVTGQAIADATAAGYQGFLKAIDVRDSGYVAPEVVSGEPLEAQARDFLGCIESGREPVAGAASAIAVAQAIEMVRGAQG